MDRNFHVAARAILLAGAGFGFVVSAPAFAQTATGASVAANTSANNSDSGGSPTAAPANGQSQPSTPAAAQDDGGVKDIVVTAQRRSENLQNVPVAVTALTPETLAVAGVTSTDDLKALTPGLNFNTNLGGFGQPRIRGVGTTATGPGIENPTATYIDNVYIGTSAGALFALNDVDQVAVLKGPQGTLFGRNATGGLIQVTTRAPSIEPHAEVQFGYGNYKTVNASGYVTGGITDTLAASITGLYENQADGFGKNLFNGQDIQTHREAAGRVKLQWKPDALTKVTLSGDYSQITAADPAIRTYGLTMFGTPTPGGNRDIDLNVQPYLNSRQWGTSLTAERELGGVQLVSISAYRDSKFHVIFDADQLPINGLALDETQIDKQFSQELQLQSTGSGPFKWVAGAFYFHSIGRYDPIRTSGAFLASPFFPLQAVDLYVDQRLDSYAGYAQGTYAIDDATNITAGLRFTSDHRKIVESQTLTVAGFPVPQAPVSEAKTFNKLTWRLAIDHRFSPDVMAYASYNRGFKSGSFAPDTFPIAVLEPETLDAFEVGLKTELFDRKVRFNVAAFYYDQKNLQVNQIVQGVLLVYNASGSTSYGIDADLQARVTSNFTINAGASYLHARYKTFLNAFELFPLPTGGNSFDQNGNATGNRLQNTPDSTINAGATYDIPTSSGKFTLAANFYHNSGYFADPQNRLRQAPYELVDASVSWVSPDGHMLIRVWSKNLTNSFYYQQTNPLNVGDNYVAAAPRTFGGTIGFKF
jgi:iron complex outermembrane receptor protein